MPARSPDAAIPAALYVDQVAQALNLPLQPEHRPGVVENVERMGAIAQLVLEFPLPATVDPAPVFQP